MGEMVWFGPGGSIRKVLADIAQENYGVIDFSSSLYSLIDFGQACKRHGRGCLAGKYLGQAVLIPRRNPEGKFKLEFDGEILSEFVQLGSGLVLPKSLAYDAGAFYQNYNYPQQGIIDLVDPKRASGLEYQQFYKSLPKFG